MARGYAVPLKLTIERLKKQLKQTRTLEILQAVVICAIAADDMKEAARTLKNNRRHFMEPNGREIVNMWSNRVALLQGKNLPSDAS